MKEPSPRASRLALTAGLVAVAIVGGGGFLLGQRSTEDRGAVAPPTAGTPTPVPSPAEVTARVLGRADLLALAAEATDAATRGGGVPSAVRAAVGRPFMISLPFGCEGPADVDSEASMRWRHDEAAEALRLDVAPVAWSPGEWWADAPQTGAETVEGFWIARPWTSSEACPPSREPATPAGAEPVTLPGQTLAIGQVFRDDGPRRGRRDGKAYTAVLRMGLAEAGTSDGFRLRLMGRVSAGPDGAAVTCRQRGGAEQRPVCLILVELDELTILNAQSGAVLSTWTTGAARDGKGS